MNQRPQELHLGEDGYRCLAFLATDQREPVGAEVVRAVSAEVEVAVDVDRFDKRSIVKALPSKNAAASVPACSSPCSCVYRRSRARRR
jgi:hypothetical protein